MDSIEKTENGNAKKFSLTIENNVIKKGMKWTPVPK